MAGQRIKEVPLSRGDLEFLIETVSPEVRDRSRLAQIIREDRDFRITYLTNEKVFRRLVDDEEIFLKISPQLFFEILLRRAVRDLREIPYTVERSGTMIIPVFDTREVADLLANEDVIHYLAHMLSSFTRIETYTFTYKVRRGVWERVRFNDFDIESLKHFCGAVDDEHRLGFYKRIADICLFVLGVFPECAERPFGAAARGGLGTHGAGALKADPELYEEEGRRFYKLAAEHQAARQLDLSEIFQVLHDRFCEAKKPLNLIAEQYLSQRKEKYFM